jgi:hypothetical protein
MVTVTLTLKVTVTLKVKITVEKTGTVVATTLVSRPRLRQLFLGVYRSRNHCVYRKLPPSSTWGSESSTWGSENTSVG